MPTDRNRRMIELAHVGRNYTRADGQRVNAVDDVSLIVPEGEFVCLIGPSGCGKSTLLQMVAGLDAPSSGAIVVDGKEIAGPGRERGMVFQRDSVFPWLRVVDNVEYGLKCRGVASGERREIARDYLRRVGLSHVEQAWPRELSGGMLKRVAIAAVFANGGEVLLLDEPFGALDYVTRRQLQDVLLDLWEEPGRVVPTVLFVTHDVDEALTLADRIIAMRGGSDRRRHPRPSSAAARHRQPAAAGHGRHQAQAARPSRSRTSDGSVARRSSGMTAASDRRGWMVSLAVFAALALVWEILSWVYTVEAQPGEPMVAGWGTLFTRTFLSLSDYWQGGMGVPAVADGAARSYLAALLSVISHSLATIVRLASGLVLGGVLGFALGLARVLVSLEPQARPVAHAVSACASVARDGAAVSALVRNLFLRAGPVRRLWRRRHRLCGRRECGAQRAADLYRQRARARRLAPQLYRTVVLPAILPAMRSVVLLSLGAGWGAVLAAEYLGAQSGLGYIIVYAQQFGLLDRMFLIAILFILYTSASYWAIQRLFARLLVWAPSSQSA